MVTPMSRRERRRRRRGRFVTAKEAQLAARLAHLDYKVSGETGALKVPSKVRTWNLRGRANGHRPPPGQGWDRSDPTYVVGIQEVELARPIIHHRWRRLMAE